MWAFKILSPYISVGYWDKTCLNDTIDYLKCASETALIAFIS
jgi:hypothetical protein